MSSCKPECSRIILGAIIVKGMVKFKHANINLLLIIENIPENEKEAFEREID